MDTEVVNDWRARGKGENILPLLSRKECPDGTTKVLRHAHAPNEDSNRIPVSNY